MRAEISQHQAEVLIEVHAAHAIAPVDSTMSKALFTATSSVLKAASGQSANDVIKRRRDPFPMRHSTKDLAAFGRSIAIRCATNTRREQGAAR
jgi:hypothetical protein